jgi:ATP-dependent RNA helicase RhlE
MIATPGRLLDHFRFPYAKLDHLEILVLDEADRMLDMGFLPDIRRVLKHLPARTRQTLFFSATMPPPIVQLTREMLRNPFTVNIERQASPAVGITQAVYPVAQNLKAPLLLELLQRGDIKNVLVFTRTKHRANRLAENLMKKGVPCERIHGNRSQPQRTLALAGFKSGKYRVLVATDIAARGIDVEALSHVINFDVPHVPEDYIHRVGRTARAEMTGDASPSCLPRNRPTSPRSSGRSASACPASRCRASTTPRRRRSASRFPWPSASRRSGPGRPRNGSGRRRKRSAARRTRKS